MSRYCISRLWPVLNCDTTKHNACLILIYKPQACSYSSNTQHILYIVFQTLHVAHCNSFLCSEGTVSQHQLQSDCAQQWRRPYNINPSCAGLRHLEFRFRARGCRVKKDRIERDLCFVITNSMAHMREWLMVYFLFYADRPKVYAGG